MHDERLNSFYYDSGEHEVDNDIKDLVCGQSIIKITKISDTEISLKLSNDVELIAKSSEGCGGCSNGWVWIDNVIKTGIDGNVITNVSVDCNVEENESYDYSGTFTMFVYSMDKRIFEAKFSGCDNGYYGLGISIIARLHNNN